MQLKNKSPFKKIALFFSAFFCILLLIFAFLPWFVSTHTGKEMLLTFVNKRAPGTLKIDSLSLSWIGSQKIEGLHFDATDGKISAFCSEITCESSLFTTLSPSHHTGLIQLKHPQITIHQTLVPTPIKNKHLIQEASLFAEIPFNTVLPLFKVPFIGNLEIQKGEITIFSENTPPIVFNQIDGKIAVDKDLSRVSIQIESQTLQNNIQGSIFIDSLFKKTDSLERSLESKISLKHFPIEGVDQILALKHPEYLHLLTEAIGPSLDLEGIFFTSEDSCKASLKVLSQNVQIQIETESKEEVMTLSSPASLQMALSPSLIQKLEPQFPFLKVFFSKDPILCSLSLKTLNIPKTNKGIFLESASFLGSLGIQPFQTESGTLGCSGSISSQDLSKEVVGNLQVSLQDTKKPTLSKVQFSCKTPLTPSLRELSTSLEFGKISSSFFNSMLGTSISNIVGDFVEGGITTQGNEKKTEISLRLSSPLLQTENGSFLWEDQKLSLFKPWQINYLATPTYLSSLISPKNLSLQKQTPTTAVISALEISDFSDFKDLKIDAFITSAPLMFSHLFSLKQYALDDFSAHILANSLSQISLDVKSSRFSLQYKGGIEKDSCTLFWQKPIQIDYILTQKDFQEIYQRKEHLILLQNSPLKIKIAPGSFPLKTPSLDLLKLSGQIEGEKILLETENHKEQFVLQNLDSSFYFLGAKDSLDFSIDSNISSPFGTGKLSSAGNLKQLRSPNFLLKAQLELQKFPLEIIDPFIASKTPLSALFGSPFDLKISIDQKNDVQSFWIDGKTPLLNISGALTLNSKGLFLTDSKAPLNIDFSLTPKAYDLLSKQTESPFALSKNTAFKASVSKLNIPLLESGGIKHPDLAHLLLKAQIETDQIDFYHKANKKSVRLENSRLSLTKKDDQSPLSLVLDTLTDDSQKGALHLDAQFKKLLDEKGEVHLSQLHSDLVASFQKFPSDFLDILFPSKNRRFSDLLGRSFDMTVKASLENNSGPIAMTLASPTAKVSIEGALQSGSFTLKQNALAQIALTPETSRFFLQGGINPLSITSLYSSTPFSIEIDAKGFSLPLAANDLTRIEVPNARIQLGKVFCRNEGNLNLMLGILKAKQVEQSNELELWVTPIDFHIHQGVVNLERTEVLVAGTYDIALWGKIDLPKNKVSMILGLTASCLKQAFNIRDLPSDYVMHIPLTGTLNHIDLNKSVATSKIIALTLWQTKNVPSSAVGGLGGALVGGILNKVLAPPGNEGSTPPAKTPYPWQTSDSSSNKRRSSK